MTAPRSFIRRKEVAKMKGRQSFVDNEVSEIGKLLVHLKEARRHGDASGAKKLRRTMRNKHASISVISITAGKASIEAISKN